MLAFITVIFILRTYEVDILENMQCCIIYCSWVVKILVKINAQRSEALILSNFNYLKNMRNY